MDGEAAEVEGRDVAWLVEFDMLISSFQATTNATPRDRLFCLWEAGELCGCEASSKTVGLKLYLPL